LKGNKIFLLTSTRWNLLERPFKTSQQQIFPQPEQENFLREEFLETENPKASHQAFTEKITRFSLRFSLLLLLDLMTTNLG
jgi:hypothetical protein